MIRTIPTRVALTMIALAVSCGVVSAADGLPAGEERLIRLYDTQLTWLSIVLTIIGGVFAFLHYIGYRREAALEQREAGLIASMKNMVDIATTSQQSMHDREGSLITSMKNMVDIAATSQQSMHDREASLITSMKNMVDIATTGHKPTSDLINSMKSMVDIMTASQKLAQDIRDRLEKDDRDKIIKDEEKRAALHKLGMRLYRFVLRYNRFNMSIQDLEVERGHVIETKQKFGSAELPVEADIVEGYYYAIVKSNGRQAVESFSRVVDCQVPDSQLRTIALFNRGVDRTDLQEYGLAIGDFQELEKRHPLNLAYRYWRLEAERLKDDREESVLDRIEREFRELWSNISQQHDEENAAPMRLNVLKIRIARSLGSMLFVRKKLDDAKKILKETFLNDDSPSLYLRLRIERDQNPAADFTDEISECYAAAEAQYQSAKQLRTKLLRGMITAECLAWDKKQDLLDTRKRELVERILQAKGEGGTTVFSPISQRNENSDAIEKQIRSIQ
jgi:hypothetical protein